MAQTVIMSKVVEGLDHSAGGAFRFVLRVDDVLRGEAGNEIRFEHPIQSGPSARVPGLHPGGADRYDHRLGPRCSVRRDR